MSLQEFFVKRLVITFLTFEDCPFFMCLLLMGSHIAECLEWFLANLTRERLLPSVTFEVVHQTFVHTVSLVALGTRERFLFLMGYLVFLQAADMTETLSTLVTFMRLLASVDHDMCCQTCCGLQVGITMGAGKPCHPIVKTCVHCQSSLRRKLTLAFLALQVSQTLKSICICNIDFGLNLNICLRGDLEEVLKIAFLVVDTS